VITLFDYQPGGARSSSPVRWDWIPSFGVHISFGMDGIALVMVAMIAFLVPVVSARPGRSGCRRPFGGRVLALILTLEALMVGVFASTDAFLFYVMFELMLIRCTSSSVATAA